MGFVAGSYVFNGDVNERVQARRCCKWITLQYWRGVTTRAKRSLMTCYGGVDGGWV